MEYQVAGRSQPNKTEIHDIQIRALNREINLLVALLRYRKILTSNESGWLEYIKNDPKLALTVDQESLLTNFLDIAPRVVCPRTYEGCLALIRSHKIVGPPSISKNQSGTGIKFNDE